MSSVVKLFKLVLPLSALLSAAVIPAKAADELALPPPAIELAEQQVLKVYYFHGNARCRSCKLIESFTTQAVEQGFASAINQGRVNLQTVNLETRGNDHFIEDFQLITRSVVIAVEQDGKTVSYRRLDKVWQLIDDQQAFTNYLFREIGQLAAKHTALQAPQLTAGATHHA